MISLQLAIVEGLVPLAIRPLGPSTRAHISIGGDNQSASIRVGGGIGLSNGESTLTMLNPNQKGNYVFLFPQVAPMESGNGLPLQLWAVPAQIGNCQALSTLDVSKNPLASLPIKELNLLPRLRGITLGAAAGDAQAAPAGNPPGGVPANIRRSNRRHSQITFSNLTKHNWLG